MEKDKEKTLQEMIIEKIDLSRHLSEEEVRELIDEQIQAESKRQYLDVSIREQLRKESLEFYKSL